MIAPTGLLLLVPLGSVEQHGPHLPATTDTDIAVAVVAGLVAKAARRGRARAGRKMLGVEAVEAAAAGAGTEVRAMPALPYGASGEHEGFAGTVSIGTAALTAVLVEYGRSACRWAGAVCFVNAHGGNVMALEAACALLRDEGRDVGWLPCISTTDQRDTHAGRAETSLLLHLRPDAVDLARAEAGCTRPLPEILPSLRAGGMAAVSPNGVLGDPAGASAPEGSTILGGMIDTLARLLWPAEAGTRGSSPTVGGTGWP